MWQVFGLTQRASPETVEGDPVQAKLDVLMREVAGLAREREAWLPSVMPSSSGRRRARVEDLAFESAARDPGSLLTLDNVDLNEALANRDLPLTKNERGRLRQLNEFFVDMHGRSLLLLGIQDKNDGGGTVAYLHSPVILPFTEAEALAEMAEFGTFRVVISQAGTKAGRPRT